MGICGDNVCRLCASPSNSYVKIFDDSQLSTVGEMLLDCIFTEMEPESDYPDIVCQLCHLQLNVFYEFKRKALQHHQRFTEMIETHNAEKSPAKIKGQTRKSQSPEYCSESISDSRQPSVEREELSEFEMIRAYLKQENQLDSLPDEHDCNDCNDDDGSFIVQEIKLENFDSQEELEEIEQLETSSGQIDTSSVNQEEYLYEEEQYLDDEDADLRSDNAENIDINQSGEEIDIGSFSVSEDGTIKPKYEIQILSIESDDELQNLNEDDLQPKKKRRRSRTYRCSTCADIFENASEYRKHLLKHKVSKTCPECGTQTFNLEKHLLKAHGQPPPDSFKCSICGKNFTSAVQCETHEYRHTNVRPFPCTLCDKSFKLKCDLHIHMMCHNDVRKHKCHICGKGFRMSSHLKGHLETHSTINSIVCDICNQLFKTSTTLKYHKWQVHASDHRFKCDVCTRGFHKKDKFERHVQTHYKIKEKNATGRGFRMTSHLKGHIETHNIENKIKCTDCHKLFKTSGSLRSHRLQMHSTSPNFVCDFCNKGFARKDRLERHRSTHEKAQVILSYQFKA